VPSKLSLVGGFNPSETYESKWESSPRIGVKIKNHLAIVSFPLHFQDHFPLKHNSGRRIEIKRPVVSWFASFFSKLPTTNEKTKKEKNATRCAPTGLEVGLVVVVTPLISVINGLTGAITFNPRAPRGCNSTDNW